MDLRHQRLHLRHIARLLQAPFSTVARTALSRLGLGRLRDLEPKPPVQRHEWERPGDLIHIDIKSLARFRKVGHRITGDRQQGHSYGVGYEKVHVAVDDATRLAYVEVLADDGDRLSQPGSRLVQRSGCLTWTLRGMPAPEWCVENWPGSATILAVRSKGIRESKPVDEIRCYVTSLRTSAQALLQHVLNRWSIENSWHWPRNTQLREDAHRYREVNGVQIMATLRSLAMNALRLDGFWSITEGLAALAHDIRGLLSLLGWREPAQRGASG